MLSGYCLLRFPSRLDGHQNTTTSHESWRLQSKGHLFWLGGVAGKPLYEQKDWKNTLRIHCVDKMEHSVVTEWVLSDDIRSSTQTDKYDQRQQNDAGTKILIKCKRERNSGITQLPQFGDNSDMVRLPQKVHRHAGEAMEMNIIE